MQRTRSTERRQQTGYRKVSTAEKPRQTEAMEGSQAARRSALAER